MALHHIAFHYMRHGQTDWNRDGICVGQKDQPLNALGIRQAEVAAERVSSLGIDTIYHSPLSRAARTAEIVAAKTSIRLVPVPNLREACLGIKEGMFEHDPADDFVTAWLRGYPIPKAETFTDFRDRVVDAANCCLATGQAESVLLIAHSAVFIALTSACGLKPQEIGHCHPYKFEPTPRGWKVGESSPRP
ncbi:MAG TPA: histidine phosphatase family protein [Brevundimonas sp.]|uniref:histidine phosphatase family protein n=1 Tax=Brevundimonas aurantiaca TaxID=74316 RepID=UPI000C8DFB8A|nr:histidine phosphatase family protein [Brevundimonas sp.]HAF80174.1 histidine phosphatase family protein [Brevundimonas sp.]